MDAQTCLKKLQYVGVLNFATVDKYGNAMITEKGYYISRSCIGCGKCMKNCPQKCIMSGKPFQIIQEHCLHCGNCYEKCPVGAVKRQGIVNETK
ncbi:MAG: 4Fe-4S binding protein [Lachnospiraceae bacterium]|nr:4Fe-4S binding protein [Lachnospiraceae bacterium]